VPPIRVAVWRRNQRPRQQDLIWRGSRDARRKSTHGEEGREGPDGSPPHQPTRLVVDCASRQTPVPATVAGGEAIATAAAERLWRDKQAVFVAVLPARADLPAPPLAPALTAALGRVSAPELRPTGERLGALLHADQLQRPRLLPLALPEQRQLALRKVVEHSAARTSSAAVQ